MEAHRPSEKNERPFPLVYDFPADTIRLGGPVGGLEVTRHSGQSPPYEGGGAYLHQRREKKIFAQGFTVRKHLTRPSGARVAGYRLPAPPGHRGRGTPLRAASGA